MQIHDFLEFCAPALIALVLAGAALFTISKYKSVFWATVCFCVCTPYTEPSCPYFLCSAVSKSRCRSVFFGCATS